MSRRIAPDFEALLTCIETALHPRQSARRSRILTLPTFGPRTGFRYARTQILCGLFSFARAMQAATSVELDPAAFPPTRFQTVNDLEVLFPDIDKQFGLSGSHAIVVKSVTFQVQTTGAACRAVRGRLTFARAPV